MKPHHYMLMALIFLGLAILAGSIASSPDRAGQEAAARETASSAFSALRNLLADLLYLQLDRYHHIWMYQGHPWTTATDYLPQIWLIVRLNPHFTDAYVDGAYHLAANLERPEVGLALLEEGIARNPDSEDLIWEYAFLNQQIGLRSASVQLEACWKLLRLSRRKRGLEEAFREKNVCYLMETIYRELQPRRASDRIAARYRRRGDQIRWLEFGRNL